MIYKGGNYTSWIHVFFNELSETSWPERRLGGVVNPLMNVAVKFCDLWLEESLQLSPLCLERGSQQAILNGKLFWVEMHIFHLHGGGKKYSWSCFWLI